MESNQSFPIIWTPSAERKNNSQMQKFASFASESTSQDLSSWDKLYSWSIDDYENFWLLCSEFCQIKWHTRPDTKRKTDLTESMFNKRWFPETKLNFAENLLPEPNDKEVLISIIEGKPTRHYTGKELWNEVASCQKSLLEHGIKKGDRIAGVLANSSEAIIIMLATTSIGAIWSSCSPDFGVGGIVDRLSQIAPRIVFFSTDYYYNSKNYNCQQTIEKSLEQLPSVEKAITVNHGKQVNIPITGLTAYEDFISAKSQKTMPIDFIPTAFDHPVYIVFSSGTTGTPKCIVHGAGGTLLQHKKELLLHTDLKENDRLMYFTTCGWMMWNWMVSTLSTGASLVTFDGSPASPNLGILWKIIEEQNITILGTSPKYIQALQNAEYTPKGPYNLSHLKTILSTGSPLLPEHYEWIYQNIHNDLHLASISGGTDILSCFMLGNPLLPVRIGEIQSPGLGMAIESWNEDAEPVTGSKGELVCIKPFVSMPVMFWGDSENKKYHSSYFEYYPGKEVWRHGDYIEVTKNGGIIVYGRSDATLNPGGVRIGTAEIYRQVEQLTEVDSSIAVGYRRHDDGDTEIILFTKLSTGNQLSPNLIKTIKTKIRLNLTPRHVPKEVIAVKDIPFTRSGKKVEIAVTKAIHGETVKNLTALINPEAIQEFYEIGRKL